MAPGQGHVESPLNARLSAAGTRGSRASSPRLPRRGPQAAAPHQLDQRGPGLRADRDRQQLPLQLVHDTGRIRRRDREARVETRLAVRRPPSDVHALDEGPLAGPEARDVGIARRRARAVQAFAHELQLAVHGLGEGRGVAHPEQAGEARDEDEGPLHLAARELEPEELGREQDGAHHLTQVSAVARNVWAAWSTSVSGGSSATNRTQSL